MWPIWWRHGSEQNFIGPLVSYEEAQPNFHLTIRPLLLDYNSEPGGWSSLLWPLGGWDEEKAYFVPVYYSKRSEDAWDTSFLLAFWGESKGRGYGGFFPFAGKMYHRFGKDEIGFFLWPIYSHTRDPFGAERTQVVWPFFTSYGGTEQGFAAWPFYGYREKPGEKWKQSLLWPIFLRGQTDLNTDDPKDFFYIFPLYTGQTSEKTASHTFLWPFIRYTRTESVERYDVPWPFVQIMRGEEEKKSAFFPFYWRYEAGEDDVLYVMWPFYKHSKRFADNRRWYEQRWLLINRYLEEDKDRFLNVWPLFEYRRKKAESTLYVPSILPFRNDQFDRIVRPLLTLYTRKTAGDGTLTNVLYGLYTKEEKGESWRMRFAFLIELKKEPEGYGLELLSGLFGLDPRTVKIFFIPIPRSAESGRPPATSRQ